MYDAKILSRYRTYLGTIYDASALLFFLMKNLKFCRLSPKIGGTVDGQTIMTFSAPARPTRHTTNARYDDRDLLLLTLDYYTYLSVVPILLHKTTLLRFTLSEVEAKVW